MRLSALFLCIAAVAAAGCGDDEAPTAPSTKTPTTVTERFDAIIDVKDAKFFPFSVNQSGGTVSINFASLSPIDRPGLLTIPMEIGYGTTVLDDDSTVVGCDVRNAVQATPAFTAQLSEQVTAATNYCARIADLGSLRESANFSIRITHR